MGLEQMMAGQGVDPNLLLASMKGNNGEDDYFKWIILLAFLRGGILGDDKAGAAPAAADVSGVKDQICNLLGESKDSAAMLQNAISQSSALAQKCCCDTQNLVNQQSCDTRQAVYSGDANLAQQIANGFNQGQLLACETQRAVDKCCCDSQNNVRTEAQNTRNFVLGETNRLQDGLDNQNESMARIAAQNAVDTCETRNQINLGFSTVDNNLCRQTEFLTTQATANTQRVIDGQQRILDTMSENRIRELEAANTQLRTEAMISAQTQHIITQCGCCGNGHHNGNGGPPWGNGGPPGPG